MTEKSVRQCHCIPGKICVSVDVEVLVIMVNQRIQMPPWMIYIMVSSDMNMKNDWEIGRQWFGGNRVMLLIWFEMLSNDFHNLYAINWLKWCILEMSCKCKLNQFYELFNLNWIVLDEITLHLICHDTNRLYWIQLCWIQLDILWCLFLYRYHIISLSFYLFVLAKQLVGGGKLWKMLA